MSALEEQFVTEARELVRQATDNLIALERDGTSERVDSVFRAFHTLKGSAGVVELSAMSIMLHAAEDLLDRVRHGTLGASAEIVDAAWPVSIRCRVGSTTSGCRCAAFRAGEKPSDGGTIAIACAGPEARSKLPAPNPLKEGDRGPSPNGSARSRRSAMR